jgi:hypothetical protein
MENNGAQNNFGLNYTDITYGQIMDKVSKKLSEDPRFQNYQQSDVGVMQTELFAGIAELINYNLERTAEESFFNTLRRYRSATKHAADLAYDIQRPTPARAQIKFVISGKTPLKQNSSDTEGHDVFKKYKNIFIPANTVLSHNGSKYILTRDFNYTLSTQEYNRLVGGGNIEVKLMDDQGVKTYISVLQGESKLVELHPKDFTENFTIDGDGKTYQSYYIADKTFSNFYGESDPFGNTTSVQIGQYYQDAVSNGKHTIYRRSLISGKEIEARSLKRAQFYKGDVASSRQLVDGSTLEYEHVPDDKERKIEQNLSVWVKTASEVADGQGVEIKFGDGTSTSAGCTDGKDRVYVQYLSTEGSKGNRFGVIEQTLSLSNLSTLAFNDFIKIVPIFTTNITGGGDIESIESIKNSAPGMFQTFDRLVTKKDYVSFLKTLTSPIDVKNAIAWGEQDELDNSQYHNALRDNISHYKAIRKLFNVVLYTVVGSLYEEVPGLEKGSDTIYRPRVNMHNATLDNYSGKYIYPSQNYITIMAQQEVVKQLKLDNKMLEGSIPIEDFQFDIQLPPLSDVSEYTFNNFMSNYAMYKTSKNTTVTPDTATGLFKINDVSITTVPTKLNIALSNDDATQVQPIHTEVNMLLGESLNTVVDLDSAILGGNQSLASFGSLPNFKAKLAVQTYDVINNIQQDNIYELNEIPFFNTKTILVNNSQRRIAESYITTEPQANALPLSYLINPALSLDSAVEFQNLPKSAVPTLQKSFAVDMYFDLMKSTYNPNIVPSQTFGTTSPLDADSTTYEHYTIHRESLTVHPLVPVSDLPFINKEIVSWTPWGKIVSEIEDAANASVVNAVQSYNTAEIKSFKYFNFKVNIEQDEKFNNVNNVGVGYIDRMLKQQNQTSYGADLQNVSDFVERVLPINTDITQYEIDYGVQFPLVYNVADLGDSRDLTHVYRTLVYSSIDVIKQTAVINEQRTDLTYAEVYEVLKETGKTLLTTAALGDIVSDEDLKKNEILAISTESDTKTTIIYPTVKYGQKEYKYFSSETILNFDADVVYVDGDVSPRKTYEAIEKLGGKFDDVEYLGQQYINNQNYDPQMNIEFDVTLSPKLLNALEFIKYTAGDTVLINELIEDSWATRVVSATDTNQTELFNDLKTAFQVIPSHIFDDYSDETLLANKFIIHEFVKAGVSVYKRGTTPPETGYTLTSSYVISVESMNLVIHALSKVSNRAGETIINAIAYRSGDYYGEGIQITGSFRNMLPYFSADKKQRNPGTDFTNISITLQPDNDYRLISDEDDSAPSVFNPSNTTNAKKELELEGVPLLHPFETDEDKSMDWALTLAILSGKDPVSGNGEWNGSLSTIIAAENKRVEEIGTGLEYILGFDPKLTSSSAYYNTNDVNVPDNKYSDKIAICNERMKERNQTTIKTVYISPIIHEFQIRGSINVANLTNIPLIQSKINNAVYEFLDVKNDFGTKLYISNIIEIIESFPEVINANISFAPQEKSPTPGGQQYYFDIDTFQYASWQHPMFSIIPDESDRIKFKDIVISSIKNYIALHRLNVEPLSSEAFIPDNNKLDDRKYQRIYDGALHLDGVENSGTHVFKFDQHSLSTGVNERSFLNQLCRNIITKSIKEEIMTANGYDITRHKLFFMMLAEIHKDFLNVIQFNMLNSHGDIDSEYSDEFILKDGTLARDYLRGGYSLNNEIIQVHFNADIKYKDNYNG